MASCGLKYDRSQIGIISSNLSIISGIILMLVSSWVYVFWEIKFKGAFYILFVLLRLVTITINRYKTYNPGILPTIAWILFFLWWGVYKISSIQSIIMNFFLYVPMLMVLMMGNDEKRKLREWTFDIIAFIIGISILYFILYLVGINLPHKVLSSNTRPEPYICYYFFIMPLNQPFRFCSVFTEPGHLGMISALFLYMNGYNLKKLRNVVFLIALLLSFSFAGYVLLLIGWFFYILLSGKSIKNFIIIFCVLLGLGTVVERATEVNGTGLVSLLILDRAKIDNKAGIQGNNRTTPQFDKYYNTLSPDKLLEGVGFSNDTTFENLMKNGGNNSIKVTIMEYGFIGLLLLLFFFLSIIISKPSFLGFGLFAVFLVSYFQRIYWLWPIESFMYICSAFYFYKHRN